MYTTGAPDASKSTLSIYWKKAATNRWKKKVKCALYVDTLHINDVSSPTQTPPLCPGLIKYEE